MCTSSKQKKAEQTAAQQAAEANIRAGEEIRAASERAKQELIAQGKLTRQQMIEAGLPTPEESERLARARGKATTSAEALMTEAGPIAQAVARRIQERVDRPGLDYDTQSAAFTEGVTAPLWRTLKARGIVSPPGAEGGGGLTTQQYMKGAEPALAELRANAIAEDISRGQEYGEQGRTLQKFWAEMERLLGEALRNRQYESGIRGAEAEQLGVTGGAPYGVSGAEAAGRGRITAADINQAEVNKRYARQNEEKQRMGETIGQILASVLSGGAAAGTGGAAAGMGTVLTAPPNYYKSKAARITPSIRGIKPEYSSELPLALQKRLVRA